MAQYSIYITPTAWDEVDKLPGRMRQRVRRAITNLAHEPRPAQSKPLTNPIQADSLPKEADEELEPNRELRRIRLERWRIIYAITESEQVVDVLAVRKRPPYDYGDLASLLQQ